MFWECRPWREGEGTVVAGEDQLRRIEGLEHEMIGVLTGLGTNGEGCCATVRIIGIGWLSSTHHSAAKSDGDTNSHIWRGYQDPTAHRS